MRLNEVRKLSPPAHKAPPTHHDQERQHEARRLLRRRVSAVDYSQERRLVEGLVGRGNEELGSSLTILGHDVFAPAVRAGDARTTNTHAHAQAQAHVINIAGERWEKGKGQESRKA